MVSASASAPYGRQLLPSLLDYIAREDPTRVLFYTPRNDQPSQGYDVVTASKFSNSVNNLCWWLESQLGSNIGSKTIGYIGQNDLRYFLMMMAAAKVGHKLLLSSPRNSIEGHKSLIKASGCELWITTAGIDNVDFIQTLGLPHIQVPELSDLLNIEPVQPYLYTKTWEQGRNDVFALLHTSGSTGLPKLVPVYLGTAASIDAFHLMKPIDGNMPAGVAWTGIRMLCAMPLFHVAGICLGLFSALFFHWSVALPSTGPIMQHVIEAALDNIQLDSAFISPSVLQDISKTPRILEKLSKLKFISSAGGPVTQSVGDVIHPRVPIHQTMGMTEAQWLASVVTHPNEWAYFRFHPETGYEMRPYSDGMYELTFIKRKELALTQPVFVTFPNLDSWETKDLWTPHPTIPDLWKYQMRRDDLIVLSNGEKFNPLGAEGKIMGHPKIAAAVITGRARFQAAALLLPTDQHINEADDDIIDSVWSTIGIANKTLPAHAQIHRAFVKIVRVPFPRTPKGSLARNEAEKVFADTIDEIYKKISEVDVVSFALDATSVESIRAGIRDAIHTVSGIKSLGDDDSIFTRGFDSLNVIRLVRLLKSAFNPPIPIENDVIYTNPSISTLSHAVWTLLHHGPAENTTMTDTILSTFANFSRSFEGSRRAKEHVVITGTSGSVGPYLLDALCKSDRVATVWCLNRSSDGERRQIQLARSKGLTVDWNSKAKFLQLDLASQTLGLRGSELEAIKDQATVIIHNAWEVNFHLPLPSFEPHLAGLQNLVGVCRETRHKVKFFFVSSIGTAGNWPSELLGPVPETAITNLESPINGYGASKLVAEHLLSRAAQSGIVNLSILRVGQVAGPVRSNQNGGEWTRRDWLPAIIDASVYINVLPSDLGSASTLDWIPVDLLAEVTSELVNADRRTEPQETFYNLLNPRTSSWQDLVPHIQARLTTTLSTEVRVVSFRDWIDLLRNAEDKITLDAGTATNGTFAGAKNAEAGLKLVSFFESLASGVDTSLLENGIKKGSSAGRRVQWVTNNASLQSSTFAEMAPVSMAWFDRWLDQWGY